MNNLPVMSGLYIHIPFCHSKCHYCDFYSGPLACDHDRYIDALIRELYCRSGEIEMPPRTIYIGGGTPSLLSAERLGRLFAALPAEAAEEFTIEVNPEDVTGEFAAFVASSPVNRVSMGVQSADDDILRRIGRRHSWADVVTAVSRLRDAGIANISLDLIFGLPGQTLEGWSRTVDAALTLCPQHLSAYCLMYEPGTRLSAMLRAGKIEETAPEVLERMYMILCEKTASAGFRHYEISNFALPGYESRHNSSYWNLTPYLGIGAAAHSFDGDVRRSNPADIQEYVSSDGPVFATEHLSNGERIDEYLLIRLRTAEGVDMADYERHFGAEEARRLLTAAEAHLAAGRLLLADGRLRIPERHWLITDSILVDLFSQSW